MGDPTRWTHATGRRFLRAPIYDLINEYLVLPGLGSVDNDIGSQLLFHSQRDFVPLGTRSACLIKDGLYTTYSCNAPMHLLKGSRSAYWTIELILRLMFVLVKFDVDA